MPDFGLQRNRAVHPCFFNSHRTKRFTLTASGYVADEYIKHFWGNAKEAACCYQWNWTCTKKVNDRCSNREVAPVMKVEMIDLHNARIKWKQYPSLWMAHFVFFFLFFLIHLVLGSTACIVCGKNNPRMHYSKVKAKNDLYYKLNEMKRSF